LGCFCFPYLLWIVVLVFWYRLLECLRGNVGWNLPGGFVDMCISLFLCFSSLVVDLVPHCGCEYFLLGVDVVCHCFCSTCCDLCAAAWVTVLCNLHSRLLCYSVAVSFALTVFRT